MLLQLPLLVLLGVATSASASFGSRMMKRSARHLPRHPPKPGHAPADYFALAKRDKSPNPARKTYSGCRATGSLCAGSHADSDIQMGECWSNARVMGQKTAIFEPFEPGHKSYDSEGGPYGTCTAYPCYPNEADLEASDNLANLCFFWDGTDSTETGLSRRDSDEEKEKDDKYNDKVGHDDEDEESGDDDVMVEDEGDSDEDEDDNGSSKKDTKNYKEDTDTASDTSGSTSDSGDSYSNATGSDTMPNAPGTAIVPMPMICPHNLDDCYSASYFESGGKLAAFADAKPTYQGVWFPPKGSDGQPLFCQGLGLGCETPTMSDLQTSKLSSAGCDVSQCAQRS